MTEPASQTHAIKVVHTGDKCFVRLDGQEIACYSVLIKVDPGVMPTVVLELPASKVEFEGEGLVEALERDLFKELDNDN